MKNIDSKYSASKYKNIDDEISRVSQNSLKIGSIAKTKKPAVSNDVIHYHRIKHHDWAKKEKLKSFTRHPILYKDAVVAVLAMFSQKSL
jgi:hypothetical protein